MDYVKTKILYIATLTDISDYKTAEEQIHQLAFYDPLTGLPNRRLLSERLQHTIDVCSRDNTLMALMILDLDNFKRINDSLGHTSGDELLQQVATRLFEHQRNADMITRLGGDEFAVLLENINHAEDAAHIAENIISDLSRPFYLSVDPTHEIRIGASVGISLYEQHGTTPAQLMDNADAALYKAKDSGRNCFAYFSEELTIAARQRIELENRVRLVIEREELVVHYQAQVDIATDKIIGAEALIRWKYPIVGIASPWHFINFAEENGFIDTVGEWILRETCRQGKQWLDAGLPPLVLAVNVSPLQFQHDNIASLVAEVLRDTEFPAHYLELELTESDLMVDQNKTRCVLDSLRQLGIYLAIDDFGTGYSSLAYLKHFPVSTLKIDKSFIDDIPHHQDDMAITATIIAMGHILGFKVLAEGVETAAQLAFLQEKGCDSYQGYIKSKPLPTAEFEQLLRGQL